jgi:hypothetical protein
VKIFFKKCHKTGAIHVDWAISMGLFLLYIVLLFILLKPGAEVEHKPESLFTIIENNFFPETSIIVKEVNFIVDRCIGLGIPPQPSTTITLDSLSNDYRFSKLIDAKTRTDLKGTTGIKSEGSSITIKCGKEEEDHPGISKKTFLIATSYSDRHIDFTNPALSPIYELICDPKNEMFCKASLGTINNFFGFSEEYIGDLKKIPYEILSEKWGFPLSKRFKITATKLRNENTIEISDGTEPPAGINVFVKEYPGVYLNSRNDRENVIVRVHVW